MSVVLQLSDTHLSRRPHGDVNGRDPDARLATVLAAWKALEEPVDLILLTGDLADDGSAEACERLAAAVGGLGAPVLALPGNHDVPAVVSEAFAATAQVVDLGAWTVVGFDTSRPLQVEGTLDVEAALAVIDGLDGRPTLVALHHPPVSRSTNPWFQLTGAQELLAGLAARPQVKIVASGHLHDAFEFEGPGGVALLGCPSTLMAIGHDGEAMELGADAPTGARVLRLADDGEWTSTVLVA